MPGGLESGLTAMEDGQAPMQGTKQLLRSCCNCRSAKTKCVPSVHPNRSCQRCTRLDKNCVFNQVQTRSKRGKTSQTRVAELEKKLDGIYSILRTETVQQQTAGLQNSGPPGPSAAPFDPHQNEIPSGIPVMDPQNGCLGTPDSLASLAEPPAPADVIQKGMISLQEAAELIDTFNAKFSRFPFLTIPSSSELKRFRCERPFLLLAVLTIAARNRIVLHESLRDEFRKVLATRLIVDVSKDIDLLQGLLTQLAWYHLFLKQWPKQMYMLAQIAVTMALDLETDVKETTQSSAEIQRTFVGVYYLSSSISMAVRKPITMRYNELVDDCCMSLARVSSKASDKILIHLVRLQKVAEDISNVFGYETAKRRLPSMGVGGVALSVKAFETRLDGMRSSLTSDAADSSALMLAYDNTYIHLYEVCIVLGERTQATPETVSQGLQPTSTTRTNLFINCLDAVKNFFNRYLQLPPKESMGHSIVEKGQLSHAIVVLVKLSFCTDTGLEASVWQQACDVESYLEAISGRLDCIPTTTGMHGAHWQFKDSIARIKAWYQRMLYFSTSGTPAVLKTMSPLELMEITRKEPVFDMNFSDFDFSGMDVLWE